MRKFITGIKCRSERAVNKALGHKVNMGGNKTLGWVVTKGEVPDLRTGGVGKAKVLVGTALEVGIMHRDQGHDISGCEGATTAVLQVLSKSV